MLGDGFIVKVQESGRVKYLVLSLDGMTRVLIGGDGNETMVISVEGEPGIGGLINVKLELDSLTDNGHSRRL